MIGSAALTDDPCFTTREARKAHEDELDQAIEAWTRQREHLEIARALQANRVTAGAVLEWQPLLGDEHLVARGFFLDVEHADAESKGAAGILCRPQGMPPVSYRPAPRLGQHNRAILGGLLGMTDQEIGGLEMTTALGYER